VLLAQELRSLVGPVDLESLVVVGAVAQPEVVQNAAEEEQFLVVVGAGSQVAGAGERFGEQVAAHAVVEHELRVLWWLSW